MPRYRPYPHRKPEVLKRTVLREKNSPVQIFFTISCNPAVGSTILNLVTGLGELVVSTQITVDLNLNKQYSPG